jgi:hypothetical protein
MNLPPAPLPKDATRAQLIERYEVAAAKFAEIHKQEQAARIAPLGSIDVVVFAILVGLLAPEIRMVATNHESGRGLVSALVATVSLALMHRGRSRPSWRTLVIGAAVGLGVAAASIWVSPL